MCPANCWASWGPYTDLIPQTHPKQIPLIVCCSLLGARSVLGTAAVLAAARALGSSPADSRAGCPTRAAQQRASHFLNFCVLLMLCAAVVHIAGDEVCQGLET